MRKSKIIISVFAVILLSLLLVSCKYNNAPITTEEIIQTDFITVTPSQEPIAKEMELPIEETAVAIPPKSTTPSVSQTEIKTPEPEPEPELEIEIEIEERLPSKNDMLCSLTVRCDDILQNMDKLKQDKEKFIPDDGVILPKAELTFSSGESVFDVLYRAVKEKGIHIEFVNTPMYNSVYIEGIANLYEFDCGKNSGWIYTVNGESPMYGCSQYILSLGDNIEFIYKCNLFS